MFGKRFNVLAVASSYGRRSRVLNIILPGPLVIFGSYSNNLSGNRLILPWVLSKQCSCKHADSHLVDQSAPGGKCRCGELTD